MQRALTVGRWLVTAGYLAGGAVATIRNKSLWPVSPYNMFSYHAPRQVDQLRVQLFDGQVWSPMTDVWGLLPLEFFQVVTKLASTYLEPDVPEQRKQAVAELIVSELNDRPWTRRDEVRASLQHPSGRPVTGLRILLIAVDFDTWDPTNRQEVIRSSVLFEDEAVVDPTCNLSEAVRPS